MGLKENYSDLFLSSGKSDNPKQIGRLSAFRNSDKFEIRTIYSGLDTGFFNREFTLVLPEGAKFSDFKEFMSELGYELSDVSLDIPKSLGTPTMMRSSLVSWVSMFVGMTVVLLTISFSIFNTYRKIGIEKMLGYSLFDIWVKRMPAVFFAELLSYILVPLAAYFLLFSQTSLLIWAFYKDLFLQYAVLMLVLETAPAESHRRGA